MLKGLFGAKGDKNKKQGPTPPLSLGITNAIQCVVGARGIPTMPGAAQKAFQISTDPNAEARDFIEIIESDEALSARVLKIANSVYFDRGNPSSTIEESVVTIGMNELRSLLSATTLSELFPSQRPERIQLWAHDVATALISKALTARLSAGSEDTAFLAGLMHDIGKLLLLHRVPDDYLQILQQVASGEDFCRAEERRFPFNHTEAGHLVAERWNFSPELIDVIRRHHNSWEELAETGAPLTTLVKAANILAHALGLGHPDNFNRVQTKAQEELGQVWKFLDIPESERSGMLDSLKRTFDMEYDLYAGG